MGIRIGGATWSWLYARYDNIDAAWLIRLTFSIRADNQADPQARMKMGHEDAKTRRIIV